MNSKILHFVQKTVVKKIKSKTKRKAKKKIKSEVKKDISAKIKQNIDYTLYLCTDRVLMSSATVEESVEKAIKGGVTIVQLREKDCSSKKFYETALSVKKITDQYNVPLIINDRVDIAMASGAAGVHIGQSDLPVKVVRKLIGYDKMIGVSVANVEEAVKACDEGADYLGVGAMYATDTKKNTRPVSMEELMRIRETVDIPIVVIGGINKNTLLNFKNKGINGLAVISAIVAQEDIQGAAREMYIAFTDREPNQNKNVKKIEPIKVRF